MVCGSLFTEVREFGKVIRFRFARRPPGGMVYDDRDRNPQSPDNINVRIRR